MLKTHSTSFIMKINSQLNLTDILHFFPKEFSSLHVKIKIPISNIYAESACLPYPDKLTAAKSPPSEYMKTIIAPVIEQQHCILMNSRHVLLTIQQVNSAKQDMRASARHVAHPTRTMRCLVSCSSLFCRQIVQRYVNEGR